MIRHTLAQGTSQDRLKTIGYHVPRWVHEDGNLESAHRSALHDGREQGIRLLEP
jgi:hypothetical protein